MTPACRKALERLAGDDPDEHEIACGGIECYIGYTRISRATVHKLLRLTAISRCSFGGEYYTINEMGRALLARPEIEEEWARALAKGGSWTIKDNRIVSF